MATTKFTPEPPIYTFRVRILDCMAGYAPENATEIQREIEIAANQTLGDLAFAILDAYKFEDDHLFSFFLSGKPWDRATEYAYYGDEEDDPFTDIAALLPEDSEMHKLAALADDPNLDPDGPLPPGIDEEKLRQEFAGVLQQLAADAPAADRAAIAEFAGLLRTNAKVEETMMSDTLKRYIEAGQAEIAQSLPLPAFPGIDRADFDLFGEDEDEAADVDEILIRDVPYPGKTGKKEFLFLFDYGDEWRFGVKLLGTSDKKTPRARYPRVTARRGKAPAQYPPWDDEEGDGGAWEAEDDIPHATVFRIDPVTKLMTPETVIIAPRPKDKS